MTEQNDTLSELELDKVVGGLNPQPLPPGRTYEDVLNIGSQTSGAGAGKITFNPF
jgi:hypothetical protein